MLDPKSRAWSHHGDANRLQSSDIQPKETFAHIHLSGLGTRNHAKRGLAFSNRVSRRIRNQKMRKLVLSIWLPSGVSPFFFVWGSKRNQHCI